VPENTLKSPSASCCPRSACSGPGGPGRALAREDLAILGFAALFLVAAVAAVTLVRSRAREALP